MVYFVRYILHGIFCPVYFVQYILSGILCLGIFCSGIFCPGIICPGTFYPVTIYIYIYIQGRFGSIVLYQLAMMQCAIPINHDALFHNN